ncbi:MAG: DUF262 domain-containing protein [Desulfobacteraceae bacterium]|jgi:hypothetical protein|nr:DUF262 domain-containing protein [Desulfobacteraceae bacterium]
MSGPLFKRIDCDVEYIISAIDQGNIGLPDIQRPFVWSAAKIRDLFDSMFRGYPIGYLLLWAAPENEGTKQIGTSEHGTDTPSTLIIDGQQRLTSLFAVMKGKPVLTKDFQEKTIAISFRPLTSDFEVSTAAHKRSPEWITNISDIYTRSEGAYKIISQFISQLSEHRELNPEEDEMIAENIQRLLQLKKYPFSALEINSSTDEEDVADIFVRVNSQGQKLNQADFILTLMSVFWEDGRNALEFFCKQSRKAGAKDISSYNYFIEPDPDQLLRVSIGLGFRRARLKYAYLILRGKDLETGLYSPERREEQFKKLQEVQKKVLDLQNWHEFLKIPVYAGYRSTAMITSETAVVYSYVFFLIGKYDFNVEPHILRSVIAQWFFMSSVTGRYSSSPESRMEQDLADLRIIKNSAQYIDHLQKVIGGVLTSDFWSISLPNSLSTAAARSPSWFGYCASLNLLGAPVLFSKMKVSELLDPITNSKKTALERHHLFPKSYLAKIDIKDDRDRNQIANFALVEWDDNNHISGSSPQEYLPKYIERFKDSPEELSQMMALHALPAQWEFMLYEEFLRERRRLLAGIIRKGYERLAKIEKKDVKSDLLLNDLISQGESGSIEFKSTLRVNLHTGQKDNKIEYAVLKTIAAFLNTRGGHLLIGVKDSGEVLGIDIDGFANNDKMLLHLDNIISNRIGSHQMLFIQSRFEANSEKQVLIIKCSPSNSPAYLSEGNNKQFFIRAGASTKELPVDEIHTFINKRFE